MNVGRCPGNPPPRNAGDKERKIADGPKFSKAEVLPLLSADPVALRVWTIDCGDDIAKLGLDMPAVANIVSEAISVGKFKGSEWCTQNPDGPWAICDAYVLRRKEWNKVAKKDLEVEYYVKFAINRGGTVLLLISCHT